MDANSKNLTLRGYVKQTVKNYLTTLDGSKAQNLYDMVLAEVEIALFDVALAEVSGNQSKAADMLGMSRTTLRKKINSYSSSTVIVSEAKQSNCSVIVNEAKQSNCSVIASEAKQSNSSVIASEAKQSRY